MKTIITMFFLIYLSAASSHADIITQEEFRCLSQNIYHEARGESFVGQRSVARVTLNRMESNRFPDNICRVVYQRGQFSWVKNNPSMKNKEALRISRIAAIAGAISHNLDAADPTGGALFFHSGKKPAGWKRKFTVRIGNHAFYR